MASTFIYALCEPDTRKVRYIGKANNPLKRLGLHLSVSAKLDTHLGHWLSKLRESGTKPILSVLREVPEEIWQEEEIGYIRQARELGMNLVNGNGGGIGGHAPTPATREKKRIASLGERNGMFGRPSPLRGSKKTSEQRLAQSQRQTGGKHPNRRVAVPRFGRPSTMKGRKQSKVTVARMKDAAKSRIRGPRGTFLPAN